MVLDLPGFLLWRIAVQDDYARLHLSQRLDHRALRKSIGTTGLIPRRLNLCCRVWSLGTRDWEGNKSCSWRQTYQLELQWVLMGWAVRRLSSWKGWETRCERVPFKCWTKASALIDVDQVEADRGEPWGEGDGWGWRAICCVCWWNCPLFICPEVWNFRNN